MDQNKNSYAYVGAEIGKFYSALRKQGVGRHLAAELTIELTKTVLKTIFKGDA